MLFKIPVKSLCYIVGFYVFLIQWQIIEYLRKTILRRDDDDVLYF